MSLSFDAHKRKNITPSHMPLALAFQFVYVFDELLSSIQFVSSTQMQARIQYDHSSTNRGRPLGSNKGEIPIDRVEAKGYDAGEVSYSGEYR
jgi:hypothetical protein